MSLPIYYYRYFTIKGSRFFVSLRKSDRRPSRSKVDLYGEKKTKLWLKLNGKLWPWWCDSSYLEQSRRCFESSISMAPPPATTASFFIARLTIMIASCNDRSVSSMNCSAPPRRIRVQVLLFGTPEKTLYRSPPICKSRRFICRWIQRVRIIDRNTTTTSVTDNVI